MDKSLKKSYLCYASTLIYFLLFAVFRYEFPLAIFILVFMLSVPTTGLIYAYRGPKGELRTLSIVLNCLPFVVYFTLFFIEVF